MKKALCFAFCFFVLFSLTSCSEDARPDMETLSRRMSLINENYAFDYFDAFIYDDAYHITFSLCSEDDVLMSVRTDKAGNIDEITVIAYAEKMKTEGERNAYMNFSSAVIDSFAQLSDKEKIEKNKKLSYRNPKRYFSDLYEEYSSLRHNFIFSSNSAYISLYCDYYEIMDLTESDIF